MLKPVTQRVGPVWWVQVGLCRAIWRGGAFPRRASMNPDFLPNEMKGMRAIENHVCGLLHEFSQLPPIMCAPMAKQTKIWAVLPKKGSLVFIIYLEGEISNKPQSG